jgi:hypothetical protein
MTSGTRLATAWPGDGVLLCELAGHSHRRRTLRQEQRLRAQSVASRIGGGARLA